MSLCGTLKRDTLWAGMAAKPQNSIQRPTSSHSPRPLIPVIPGHVLKSYAIDPQVNLSLSGLSALPSTYALPTALLPSLQFFFCALFDPHEEGKGKGGEGKGGEGREKERREGRGTRLRGGKKEEKKTNLISEYSGVA